MSINTYRGLLARSDVDKGETSVDPDLRARSSEAKVVIEGTNATVTQTVGGVTQVATGWAEATGTIAQTIGALSQSVTSQIKADLVGTITQTTPTINIDRQRRKCELTVQNGKVFGSADLTDFPILLRKECLPSEMFDSDGAFPAQANGGDIKITLYEDGSGRLPCEVVAFDTDADPADGYAEIWTKLTLDHDDDTNFYIWYSAVGGSVSQPAADSTYGSEAIWSDYAYVGHNLITDSAGNYTPVDSGTSATGNAFGNTTGAREADSYQDGVAVPVDIHTEGTYVYSLQAWGRARVDGQFKILSAGDTSSSKWVSVDTYAYGYAMHIQANGSGNGYGGHLDDLAGNQWIMFSALFTDHNSINPMILNGGSTEVNWNHSNDPRPCNQITFGKTADITPAGSYPGDICEGRLRFGSGVTPDWVYTEYANQNDPETFIVDSAPTDYSFLTPPPGVTGTVTLTLPAITQTITETVPTFALISLHHLNAGLQTLDGISTHRFAATPASLPEDVVFYCPFNDAIGTSPAAIKCYVSAAGSTAFETYTDIWESYNSGEIISTPGTNPMGYSTCYNPGENNLGGALDTDTTNGNDLVEDACYGVTTNISLELRFYLGTNSNQGSSAWSRLYGWSETFNSGDGFDAEFYSTLDDKISFYNYWGSGSGNRTGVHQEGVDLSTWYRVIHIWDLTNSRSAVFSENQNGSGGDTITSLPRIINHVRTNTAFEQSHDGAGNLFLGSYPSHSSGSNLRYNGGINELIVRVNTPNMATITASNPYVVNADPLL